MLIRTVLARCGLTLTSQAPIYIYLRDHNKHINPSTSILPLSFRNPKNLVPQAPAHKFTEYKLNKDAQTVLQRQIFEEYKNKILRGIIDEQPQKQPDPLWGEDPAPTHYYQNISKVDLMTVSHPHNNDVEGQLHKAFTAYFEQSYDKEVTKQIVENRSHDVHKIAEICVAARHQGIEDGQIWFQLESALGRGKKLYLLSPEELVKLKWAFDHKNKKGTPIFHQILAELIREDLPKLNKESLMALFYACRYSNSTKINLQLQVLEALRPFFKDMSLQEKSDLLLAFTVYTKKIKYHHKVHKRRAYQFKQKAASLLLELDFWDLPLTHDIAASLTFSLAKLQLENTRFISYPIRDHISNNLEEYCQDKDRLFQAIVYLGQLEAGEGVMGKELGGRLKELAEQRWEEFSSIERIRIVHALWVIGLMDESLMELYKSIQFQADTSILYYACQIELNNSSERQWQIIQLLAQIQILPLPYYVAYMRFYNYITATTEWNLTPLTEKLRNTEYYYSCMRQYDSLLRNSRSYRKLRQFQKFTDVSFVRKGAPIANLQLAHFGFGLHRVSLDILDKKYFVPGTTELKQTYRNKVISLRNIGWKHLAYTEDQLRDESLTQIIANIQTCYEPYIEEQKAITEYEDYRMSKEIGLQKQIQELREWELDDVNKYLAMVKGEEYMELGEEVEDKYGKQQDIPKPNKK